MATSPLTHPLAPEFFEPKDKDGKYDLLFKAKENDGSGKKTG